MVLRWTAALAVVLCMMPEGLFGFMPADINQCYKHDNYVLFNRYNRQGMSIDQLIGLIEKLERSSSGYRMSPQRLATAILKRFKYDGIIDRQVSDSSAPYVEPYTFIQPENAKFQMMYRLVNLDNAQFPEEQFTLEEKCTMHWLLSHSVNETEREDESDFCGREARRRRSPRRRGGYSRGSSGSGSSSGAQQPGTGFVGNVHDDDASNCPLEMGVVYSPYGPVAAGTLLAGIAAGLSEQDVTVEDVVGADTNTLRNLDPNIRRLPVNNIWALTLAGDVAQTALHFESFGGRSTPTVLGPRGFWNSTYCPREYSLLNRESITAMTNAEIYGGIDGYLLGSQMNNWKSHSGFRLSTVLRMYYSPDGVSYDRQFRACDRLMNLQNSDLVDMDTLQTEAENFGFAYYALDVGKMPMLVQDNLQEAMKSLVEKVVQDLSNFANRNSMTDEGPGCADVLQPSSSSDDLVCDTKADLVAVLDPSQGDSSIQAQKVFLSEMALAMDIGWNRSYLQVMSAVDGSVLLDKWNYTNKARLACDIQQINVPARQMDLMQTVEAMTTYYTSMLEQEASDAAARSNTQVLLLMTSMSRVDNEDDLVDSLNNLCDTFPDLNIFTLTDNRNVFQGVQQKMDRRQFLAENMFTTESTAKDIRTNLVPKVNTRMCQTPSRFVYPPCHTDDSSYDFNENSHEYTYYVEPGHVTYLRMGPQQFLSSSNLKLKFESLFGSLQFCVSRQDPMPADGGDDVTCMSTESLSSSQVEFTFSQPCDEDQMNDDCPPFFFSIKENPDADTSGNVNLCSDDECPYPDSIQFTLKHENMRCNSAASIGISALLLGATMFLRQLFL